MTGTFDAAGERFLLKGYLRAVKNKFQAHRIIRVDNEELVFHVDFLNERNPGEELDLVGGRGKLQSIYTDAMKAVFKYEGYSTHPEFKDVRFPSAETFIASKAMAATVKNGAGTHSMFSSLPPIKSPRPSRPPGVPSCLMDCSGMQMTRFGKRSMRVMP
jgi:hypothetical protein